MGDEMDMDKLVAAVVALPVAERVLAIDSILRSLNQAEPAIDKQWLEVAKRRRAELHGGSVRAVAGEEVFAKIRERFEQ